MYTSVKSHRTIDSKRVNFTKCKFFKVNNFFKVLKKSQSIEMKQSFSPQVIFSATD